MGTERRQSTEESKKTTSRQHVHTGTCGTVRVALRIIILVYKGSAWVTASAGTHASGRAGQHFELFDSILGRVKKITTHNRSLRVQYVR